MIYNTKSQCNASVAHRFPEVFAIPIGCFDVIWVPFSLVSLFGWVEGHGKGKKRKKKSGRRLGYSEADIKIH
ncbi:unnamed protein product [Enterobius vermicularis]|uniref:Transmembrane protein n=1 Tax=Enterobius vermicularis TaxID=51028 RepID=A0A0N4V0P0_ENTVE|nr:unnamed protein product [Enterobius vermicularis]